MLLIIPAGATLVHRDSYLHTQLQRYRCKSSSVYLHTFHNLPYLLHGPGSVNTMMSIVLIPWMVLFQAECLAPWYMSLEHTASLKESKQFENRGWDTGGKQWPFKLYFAAIQVRFSYFTFAISKLRLFFFIQKQCCYLCCGQSSHMYSEFIFRDVNLFFRWVMC